MYIDIGARDKKEAEAVVSVGDVAVFDSDFVRFGSGNGFIKAKAIDDRFGCAVMVTLMEEELPMDVTFVFSVQEEVGTRGAFGAAFSVKPDIALILEGTTSADLAKVPGHKKVTRLGEGPVLGFMDAGTIYDRGLFEQLRDLAVENGIPWQIKGRIAGGTDASAIQRSRQGVRVANISAPVRSIHCPNSVAKVSDIEDGLKLARLFVEAVAAGKIK
jgi:endoglucanase